MKSLPSPPVARSGHRGIGGSQVQDMYAGGQVAEINDYCRCDVLDTYFVFLRSQVLTGALSLEKEQGIVAETKDWLSERAASSPAFFHYLEHWGDWLPAETQHISPQQGDAQ